MATEEDNDIGEEATGSGKRMRAIRTYPPDSFSDCLELGGAIHTYAPGGRVRRLTLMEKMGRSPTSGPTRTLIANSAKYGITKGSYNSDFLELTSEGKTVVDDTQPERDRLRAKFHLAVESVSPFKKLYDEYVNGRLPAIEVMRDFLQESGEEISDYRECADIFIVNVKHIDLLRTIAGAELLIPVEQAIEELSSSTDSLTRSSTASFNKIEQSVAGVPTVEDDWSRICFYITPIGADDGLERKHADLFLNSLVEPAISEIGLRLVRADKIGQPGMITSQVIEHVKRSRLVIVDMSFLNPNVFYEMALRHACKLPVVHVIRKADRIPFDVNQSRCIVIDNSDIYSLVPKLQTYKAEIATQARKALEDPEHCGNPITVFFPAFWEQITNNELASVSDLPRD